MTNIESDIYYPRIAVAAVDLLGIKALLLKDDKALAAMNAMELLRKNAVVKNYFHTPACETVAGSLYKTEEYFSDSVYFFPIPELEIEKQLDQLVMKCAMLLMIGLYSYPSGGCLMRAGVSVGNLRVRVIETENGYQKICIGTAMVKAHLLQEAQDWVGGAVEGGFPKNALDNNRIEYAVPLKEIPDAFNVSPQAINWVSLMTQNGCGKTRIVEAITSLISQTGNETERHDNKLSHTIKFVEYVLDHYGHDR